MFLKSKLGWFIYCSELTIHLVIYRSLDSLVKNSIPLSSLQWWKVSYEMANLE